MRKARSPQAFTLTGWMPVIRKTFTCKARLRHGLTALLILCGTLGSERLFADLPGDTTVYYAGGKKGHIAECKRMEKRLSDPEKKAELMQNKTTLSEMKAQGGGLCSRCPGSKLNDKLKAEKMARAIKLNKQYDPDPSSPKEKYGRKGWNARKSRLNEPEKNYDPNTPAVCDALWMRVHEEDCPRLVLKDRKKVIPLEQADKEGWRIGETGQSGRGHCCFKGYRRKHPVKGFTKHSPGLVQTVGGGKQKWHQAGCHRIARVVPNHKLMTMAEGAAAATAKGVQFYLCIHCIERGPSVTSIDPVKFAQMPTDRPAWVPYLNPLANVEEFMGRRFFFDYSSDYKDYRSTGDKNALNNLYNQARHFYSLCDNYPSAAQAKASDPEGWNFLFPMAGWSRITLQLARKYPDQVSQKEIAEAEAFLNAFIDAVKPTVEGKNNLDPDMGIPQGLADDFRNRAYNRAANGIGTLAVASKALEDLQAIKKTSSYQPTIDRYRKSVQEWVKNWETMGCMYTEANGKTYFYYAYKGTGKKRADGLMLYNADDQGHYAHTMMGATLIYESTPELGVDDDFMTAVANAIYHNSTTENGSIQAPSADAIRPVHRKNFAIPREKLFVYEAFRDGLIEAQYRRRDDPKAAAAWATTSGDKHWDYFEALRKDRSLIHLGE